MSNQSNFPLPSGYAKESSLSSSASPSTFSVLPISNSNSSQMPSFNPTEEGGSFLSKPKPFEEWMNRPMPAEEFEQVLGAGFFLNKPLPSPPIDFHGFPSAPVSEVNLERLLSMEGEAFPFPQAERFLVTKEVPLEDSEPTYELTSPQVHPSFEPCLVEESEEVTPRRSSRSKKPTAQTQIPQPKKRSSPQPKNKNTKISGAVEADEEEEDDDDGYEEPKKPQRRAKTKGVIETPASPSPPPQTPMYVYVKPPKEDKEAYQRYLLYRRVNNSAATKSRAKRKEKENKNVEIAEQLQKENEVLKQELDSLQAQFRALESLLENHLKSKAN